MKTIVKGAILLIFAVALIGAAEAAGNRSIAARYANTTAANTSTFVIGETDLTFTDYPTQIGAVVTYADCLTGQLVGQPSTSTQGAGPFSVTKNVSTAGWSGLVAGPYTLQCTTQTGGYTGISTGVVTAVAPAYSVTVRSNQKGYWGNEITSVASGDSFTINTTNNINDQLGMRPIDLTTPCKVDLVMRLSGTVANKLANVQPWWQNVTDLGTQQSYTAAGAINPIYWNTPISSGIAAQTILNLTPTQSWSAGTYEFLIDPDSTSCNGVDAPSAVLKTLTVTTSGVQFTVDKSTASVADVVTFTGKTSPFRNATVTVTSGTAANIELAALDAQALNNTTANVQLELQGKTVITGQNALLPASTIVTTKSDGSFSLQLKFNADSTYELEAKVTDAAGGSQSQKASVTIKPVSATVKTSKTTSYLGQDVDVTGTVTAGTKVLISINNKMETNTSVQADKTFKYTWSASRTQRYSEGSVNVDVWVCPQTIQGKDASDCTNAANGIYTQDDAAVDNRLTVTDSKDGLCKTNAAGGISTVCNAADKKSPDASWSISMKDQVVTVTSPASGQQIAQGEKFRITGTAPAASSSKVNVWVFNSGGTTSGGTCYADTISVSSEDTGFTFDKEVGKSEVTQDTGDYTLVVQSLGRDGIYSDGKQIGNKNNEINLQPVDTTGNGANANLKCNDDTNVVNSGFNNKIGSQISSILQDNALSKAGSDDQKVYKVIQFKVVSPSTKLNACPAAVKGSDLNVTGTTNRADGTTIIVKAVGPKELAPVTTTAKNGTYTATFKASDIGADVGTYTVTADDLKGQKDTVTCSVIAGTPCSLSVAVKSSKAQVEKDETAALTATVSNSGDETCTATSLTSSATPATAKVTWAKTSTDVPAKGSADVTGNFSASADGSYTVTVTATRGAATANGTATVTVGKAAATPAPSGAATPAPTGAATAAPSATPKPSPGFEAVFAIAGLLAVAYLVNRRKR